MAPADDADAGPVTNVDGFCAFATGVCWIGAMATMGRSGVIDAALVGSELRATISMAVPKMHTTMMPIAIGRLTVKCFIPKCFIAKPLVICFAKCLTVKRVDRFAGLSPPWGSAASPNRLDGAKGVPPIRPEDCPR